MGDHDPGCENPCAPSLGTNIINSGRLRLLPGERNNLSIEIRNSDVLWRFISGWTEPLSDLIDIMGISLRRPGDQSDSQLLRGDPIRLQQFTSDPRFGQALQFLEALDASENRSEVIFDLVNLETIQGVEVTIALSGYWAKKPVEIIDRRPRTATACLPGGGSPVQPARAVVEPHRGPIDGNGRG